MGRGTPVLKKGDQAEGVKGRKRLGCLMGGSRNRGTGNRGSGHPRNRQSKERDTVSPKLNFGA